MRIFCIHVYSTTNKDPVIISSVFELSFVSVFQRGTLKEFLNFHGRLVMSRADPEKNFEVALEKGICYALKSNDGLGVTIIADEEYPKRVAVDLLLKIMENLKTHIFQNKLNVATYTSDTDIKYSYIDTIIKEWQNPNEKDNLLKLQNELNDVTNIMKKNLNELLKREENLDALMEKSKDLSSSSVTFYKQAKKTNSCCHA